MHEFTFDPAGSTYSVCPPETAPTCAELALGPASAMRAARITAIRSAHERALSRCQADPGVVDPVNNVADETSVDCRVHLDGKRTSSCRLSALRDA
jgi:hypothetical protein